MRWRQQSVIFILQVLLPCLPTTLVTFVQGLAEAIAVILFAACQYSSCLLLLLVTVLAGANCKATAVRVTSGKKSITQFLGVSGPATCTRPEPVWHCLYSR